MTETNHKTIRSKIEQSGLSTRQVYSAVGIGRGWFMKMYAGNIKEPNPEWMQVINDFLDDIITVQDHYK